MSAPVLLSEALRVTLWQVAVRHRQQQTLRSLDLKIAELNARRAFHHNPTHENLTAWCNAKEALEDAS